MSVRLARNPRSPSPDSAFSLAGMRMRVIQAPSHAILAVDRVQLTDIFYPHEKHLPAALDRNGLDAYGTV
jgi:hypothetical protein